MYVWMIAESETFLNSYSLLSESSRYSFSKRVPQYILSSQWIFPIFLLVYHLPLLGFWGISLASMPRAWKMWVTALQLGLNWSRIEADDDEPGLATGPGAARAAVCGAPTVCPAPCWVWGCACVVFNNNKNNRLLNITNWAAFVVVVAVVLLLLLLSRRCFCCCCCCEFNLANFGAMLLLLLLLTFVTIETRRRKKTLLLPFAGFWLWL